MWRAVEAIAGRSRAMDRILSAADRLFVAARRGRRLSNLLVAAAAAWGFLFLSRLPLLLAGRRLPWSLPPTGPDAGVGAALRGALWLDARLWLVFIPLGALAVAWMLAVEARPVESLALPRRGAARAAAVGGVIGVTAILILSGVTVVLGDVGIGPSRDGVTGVAALGGVLVVTLGWAVQGTAEELLSRGWLLLSLGARYTPWFGVVVSSLLFSSFHALNPGFGWLPALNLFLIGVFFALLVLRQGCLWGAFAMHAAWNWTLGNVLGLSVSGMGMPGGALIDLDIDGPAWLVGGAFGPEGGLAATAVATSGVLGMVALMRRRTVRGHIDGVAADGVDREGDRTRSPGEGSDDAGA